MDRVLVSELFELKSEQLEWRSDVKFFLTEAKYPWELLGERLRSFILHAVNRVPRDERIQGCVHETAVIEGDDVVVEPGAVVEAQAYVAGPTYICRGAVVRQGAYVRGDVYICPGAVVGHTTEVKGSLLMYDAKAAHFAYVGNSVLGRSCNLGAGTKLANMRFDHGSVIIRLPDKQLDTGLRKFGAVLGNRSQTGCNSVTNPGTILTCDSYLRPLESGQGVIHRPLPLRR